MVEDTDGIVGELEYNVQCCAVLLPFMAFCDISVCRLCDSQEDGVPRHGDGGRSNLPPPLSTLQIHHQTRLPMSLIRHPQRPLLRSHNQSLSSSRDLFRPSLGAIIPRVWPCRCCGNACKARRAETRSFLCHLVIWVIVDKAS